MAPFPFPEMIALLEGIEMTSALVFKVSAFVVAIKTFGLLLGLKGLFDSQKQPFQYIMYCYFLLGNLFKLAIFAPGLLGVAPLQGFALALCNVLSIGFQLWGLFVPMGLHFLWALSRTTEAHTVFRRNISELDFASNVNKFSVTIIAASLLFFLQSQYEAESSIHIFFAAAIVLNMLFLWYCLLTVRGSSTKKVFVDAYNTTFTLFALITPLAFSNAVATATLIFSLNHFDQYRVITHCLETTGTLVIVVYYVIFHTQPSDLKEHATHMGGVSGVLKAKTIFKSSIERKKAD